MNPGSERISLTLNKGQGQSWGFRLQGGADFTTPLSIQSVGPGSVADQSGVKAGDAVLSINDRASDELDHEEAKRTIIMCGDAVNLVVQRGAVNVWRPKVTPMSQLRPDQVQQQAQGEEQYIQRTSLAADKQEPLRIGSSHNRAPKPFPGFGGGAPAAAPASAPAPAPAPAQAPAPAPAPAPGPAPGQPAVVHSQFNSPMQMYSEQNAQDIYARKQDQLSQQMTTNNGAFSPYNAAPAPQAAPGFAPAAAAPAAAPAAAAPPTSGFRSVRAPIAQPQSQKPQQQHSTCSVCGALIIGVFVRIKGEPMHAECYKCVKCGLNLKQQGFFKVEGKLYCESCAR